MEPHRHVTSHHYVFTLTGRQRPSVVGRLILDALASGCPECRRAWDLLAGEGDRLSERIVSVDAEASAVGGPGDEDDPPALRPVVARLEEEVGLLQLERSRRWSRDLRALLRLPAHRRADRVRGARRRFGSVGLAILLLEESRRRVRTEPAEAESLAALVPLVLRSGAAAPGDPEVHALSVRAAAHRANARRVAGDLPAAETAFVALRTELAARPLADAAVEAEVASLEASLRLGQREVQLAEELLDRAVLLYREAGDERGETRVLVQQAMLLHDLERPAEALDRLEEATPRLDPEADLYLFTTVITARVICLCELARWDEAGALLDEHVDAYEALDDPHAAAILRNLYGRVALGQARYDAAVEAFSSSRDAHLAIGRVYDAALTALDLAVAYREAGRRGELRRLATELVPAFRSRGVGRETLVALRLLVRAIAADELSADLVRRLRRRIEAERSAVPDPRD